MPLKTIDIQDTKHPFDDTRFKQGSVLIGGLVFGCGSSLAAHTSSPDALGNQNNHRRIVCRDLFRELHNAGHSLRRARIRVDLDRLAQAVIANPQLEITVDLMQKQIRADGIKCDRTILESAGSQSLTTGNWDFLGQLLEGADSGRGRLRNTFRTWRVSKRDMTGIEVAGGSGFDPDLQSYVATFEFIQLARFKILKTDEDRFTHTTSMIRVHERQPEMDRRRCGTISYDHSVGLGGACSPHLRYSNDNVT